MPTEAQPKFDIGRYVYSVLGVAQIKDIRFVYKADMAAYFEYFVAPLDSSVKPWWAGEKTIVPYTK
jgi:hypothetical protein